MEYLKEFNIKGKIYKPVKKISVGKVKEVKLHVWSDNQYYIETIGWNLSGKFYRLFES